MILIWSSCWATDVSLYHMWLILNILSKWFKFFDWKINEHTFKAFNVAFDVDFLSLSCIKICVTFGRSFSPAVSYQLTVYLVSVFEHWWLLAVYICRQVQFRQSYLLVQATIRHSLIHRWRQSLPYSKNGIDSISKHAIKATSAIWAKCQPRWGPVHVNMRAFSSTL